MNSKFLLIALVLLFSGELIAQSSSLRIVRQINHTLADMTLDNAYEQNLVYEVGLTGRGKIYIDKSYTNPEGNRVIEHAEMTLKYLNGFRQQVTNNGSRSLTLVGSAATVLLPHGDQARVGNELPITSIAGHQNQIKRLAYLFVLLQSEMDQYMLAQAFPVMN